MARLTMEGLSGLIGISRTTISRVLNNSPRVSKKTRKKVLKAVSKYHFRRNLSARDLVARSSCIIGIIVPEIQTSFYPEIIRFIEEKANTIGYSIIFYDSVHNSEREKRLLHTLEERRVDGLIVAPVSPAVNMNELIRLRREGTPFVLIDRYLTRIADCVMTDNLAGGMMITEHLIQLGHRKIAFLYSALDAHNIAARNRFKGYRVALKKHGIPYDKALVIKSKFGRGRDSFEFGYHTIKEYLSRLLEKRVTAIFAFADALAIGAMRALRDEGLRVPRDISVAGFDDLEVDPYLETPLTTVAQPKKEIGEKAVELIIRRIKGEKLPVQNILLEPQLVIRNSCISPRILKNKMEGG